jgi:Na+-driven multidrug efflux pump
MATSIGRSIGVLYQFYHLFGGSGILKVKLSQFVPDFEQIAAIVKIAAPGVLQFVIASCSWIFLAQLVATTGNDTGSAGYQTALRIMMFFILPAWGLSNAAATLVGQNLGAQQVERAVKSVYTTAKYNVIFMGTIMVLCLLLGDQIISFFTNDPAVHKIAVSALQIMSLGYIFYGIGMVLINTFNGAGDTWTPTKVNFVGFWLFQIPLAYLLAKYLKMGPTGVFMAVPIAETAITLASIMLYRKGKWKTIQV